jgi:hypothetical protein
MAVLGIKADADILKQNFTDFASTIKAKYLPQKGYTTSFTTK